MSEFLLNSINYAYNLYSWASLMVFYNINSIVNFASNSFKNDPWAFIASVILLKLF